MSAPHAGQSDGAVPDADGNGTAGESGPRGGCADGRGHGVVVVWDRPIPGIDTVLRTPRRLIVCFMPRAPTLTLGPGLDMLM